VANVSGAWREEAASPGEKGAASAPKQHSRIPMAPRNHVETTTPMSVVRSPTKAGRSGNQGSRLASSPPATLMPSA
jgi:hypothetical protein